MTLVNAKYFGIIPGHEITEMLVSMFVYAATVKGDKTITFEKGTYYIDSEKCTRKILYITNIAGG